MTLGQTQTYKVGPAPGTVLRNLLARSVVAVLVAFTYGLFFSWVALNVVGGFDFSFREMLAISLILSFVHSRFTASIK